MDYKYKLQKVVALYRSRTILVILPVFILFRVKDRVFASALFTGRTHITPYLLYLSGGLPLGAMAAQAPLVRYTEGGPALVYRGTVCGTVVLCSTFGIYILV